MNVLHHSATPEWNRDIGRYKMLTEQLAMSALESYFNLKFRRFFVCDVLMRAVDADIL